MSIPPNPRVVVTGGGGGLGRAFCLELARRGGHMVVADIDAAGAAETVALVERAGGKAVATSCDVARLDQVERLAALADEKLGGCDVVINNAGVAVGGAVGAVPIADWEWIMGINLWGVIYGCHVFAPRFKQQGRGHVINVASAAGLLSAGEMGPYNVTKAGVVALSETLASELRTHGVGVTVLCPTFFRTNISKSSRTTNNDGARAMVEKLMDRAKIQADGVARFALETADRDELYAVPHADGQWMWRLKRLVPERYYRTIVPKLMGAMRKRTADVK
jgi:NAD(P)-dependent dehydrogenase (short-subunit alcohol dehydrogenase family)